MTPKVFIDGEAGTTGLQIRQRLEKRRDLQFVVIVCACVAFLTSGCGQKSPQTFAEALQGGEWNCVAPSPDPEVTGTSHVTWFPNGEWHQVLTAKGPMPNGDQVQLEAVVRGSYRVDGETLWSEAKRAEQRKYVRNGVQEFLPESEKARIEQELMALSGAEARVESWSARRIVLRDGSDETVCTR